MFLFRCASKQLEILFSRIHIFKDICCLAIRSATDLNKLLQSVKQDQLIHSVDVKRIRRQI